MEKALGEAFSALGIGPVTAAILLIVVFIVGPFVAWLWKERVEREKPRNAELLEYSKKQSRGLAAAYGRLFANEAAKDASGQAFCDIVKAADETLMRPFWEYKPMLDATTTAKLMLVHNVLAQHYPQASKQAIDRFKERANDFYALVEGARTALGERSIVPRFWSATQRRLRRRSSGVIVKQIRALTSRPVVVNYMTIDHQNPMDVWNEDILASESAKVLFASRQIEVAEVEYFP